MNRPEQFTKVDLTPKRHHGYAVLLFIFGTFFPPLAVAARFGIGGDFWLNLLLTICGYFPAHGHNFYIQNIRNNKNHRRTPKWAVRYGLVDTSEIERKKKRSQWASRYDERLPQSALEGQEYEEGQIAGGTPNNGANGSFAQRSDDPTLWREEDERYYKGAEGAPRADSVRSGSQSSVNRRWQYPANFSEAESEEVKLDGRKGKGRRSKHKGNKNRWARTADAHAGVGYESADGTRKKKKKRNTLSRQPSLGSDNEGPEDAVGGLYGERSAPRAADPVLDDNDALAHQF